MPGLGSPVTSNNSPGVTAYLAETAETVNLLRPEFWEHLIAALFQRRHDRTQRGGSPAAHALNHITFFESWASMGI